VDNFHVDGKLTAMITDHQDTDTTTASVEGLVETGPEVGLIDDGEGLLDITSLGHSDNSAILEIKNTVLLEDWAQHSLDNHTWGWVGNERGLLMQLLSEEIDTQVSVLTGGGRSRDADNLARTPLENQEIAETDVVSWNSDGIWDSCGFGAGDTALRGASTASIFIVVTHFDWLGI